MKVFIIILIVVLLFIIGSAGMMRYFDSKPKQLKLLEPEKDEDNSR